MIDAVEGLTDQDKKIAAFAVAEGRGVILALNKWDTMPELKNSFEAARDKLRYFFGQMAYAPVLPLSAKDGEGVDKLVSTIVTLYGQLNKRIETSKLNKAVEAWVEATPPPVGPRTQFKLRYAVQTSINPQKFAIFASRPEAVAEAYVSFLRNKIREDLGMDIDTRGARDQGLARPHQRAQGRPGPRRYSGPGLPIPLAWSRAAPRFAVPSCATGEREVQPRSPRKEAVGRRANGAKPTSASSSG